MAQSILVNVYGIGSVGEGEVRSMGFPVTQCAFSPAPAGTAYGATDIYGILVYGQRNHFTVETPAQLVTAANT